MTKFILLLLLLSIFPSPNEKVVKQDYQIYHQQVLEAETFIASENYREALLVYEQIFHDYEFIFLREYQIATQLALHLNERQKAMKFLELGILNGWEMKSIKRNNYLVKWRKEKDWNPVKKAYPSLRKEYETTLNQPSRKQVKKMFSKDQWKAFKVLFHFSSKGQDKYAEKKFTPHSEQQMAELLAILEKHGFPGEKLIGNDIWMSTIISHHNSISQAYAQQDTFYPNLKPKLKLALQKGQISPIECAIIDDWYLTVKNGNGQPVYGILNAPSRKELPTINALRASVFLRSIEVRNKLITIEGKTGMNFYLASDPWFKENIGIRE